VAAGKRQVARAWRHPRSCGTRGPCALLSAQHHWRDVPARGLRHGGGATPLLFPDEMIQMELKMFYLLQAW